MRDEVAVYQGPAVRALFRQLVRDFGGVDAAAALLDCSKGTISREVNGGLPVSIAHFCGLEDALERFPITSMLADRRAARQVRQEVHDLVLRVVAENGDVSNAAVGLLCAGDPEAVMKELRESISASQQLLARLETEAAA